MTEHRNRSRVREFDWRDTIEIGSVLKTRGGKYRIVRDLRRQKNGRLLSICCVIMHCSWTKRCYTTMNRHDIKWQRLTLVPHVKAKMNGPLDEKINRDCRTRERNLTCCDVEGIP